MVSSFGAGSSILGAIDFLWPSYDSISTNPDVVNDQINDNTADSSSVEPSQD